MTVMSVIMWHYQCIHAVIMQLDQLWQVDLSPLTAARAAKDEVQNIWAGFSCAKAKKYLSRIELSQENWHFSPV